MNTTLVIGEVKYITDSFELKQQVYSTDAGSVAEKYVLEVRRNADVGS